jgi:uncharacterized protein with HEPN domain
MYPARRDSEYLEDICEAMERIVGYAAGMDYEQFLADTRTQDAIIRNLQVIGEAVKRISLQRRQGHPTLLPQIKAIPVEGS